MLLTDSHEPAIATPQETLEFVTSCTLPTPWATFQLHTFVERASGKEHLILTLGNIKDGKPVLARVHSECLTGDALFSQRCDCGAQLKAALKKIAKEKRGMLFYLRQEGRGIGLLNKLRAYSLQDEGDDTVDANRKLGFAADSRHYSICVPMLKYFNIQRLRLMTNNPHKVHALQQAGVEVIERIPLLTKCNAFNLSYLQTKSVKLGHLFPAYEKE